MKRSIPFFLLLLIALTSCGQKEAVDFIITNATIYTVDDAFNRAEAMAIKDGKIVKVGAASEIESAYSGNRMDANGKTVLPGLIDAHAHLYNLGVTLQQVNLVGTQSKHEVLERLVAFQNEKNSNYLLGRGWDQNDWEVKEFPTKEDLDSLFPDVPVALTRIDGHAYWANSKALAMAGVTSETKMDGGEVVLGTDGSPSGILIDSPMSLIRSTIPPVNKAYNIAALKDAERICFELGLTTINDAGLSQEVIELIGELQQNGELKMRVYAMASNYPENLDHFLSKGIIKTDRLNVRSVKVYADGALGSRGAALKEPYSDKHGHFGAMITPMNELQRLAQRIAKAGYQMNTHAIGDSSNVSVLKAYQEALKDKEDARWKVEHAQVVSIQDFDYFSKNIIPSVQPTHATSDMYWAEDRVGNERIKGAYAYKTLLNKAGIVALGTDFPVEKVNPMHTFYAAVARKDLDHYPEGGFRPEDALSREETLKGMTIWAAYSNFEETEKGSLEPGKFADFVILDTDIMTCPEDDIPNAKVLATYVGGEKVFEAQ
ncbi:MAG: amidohydrolase family protein [Flavobacteriaceae bacterium]|nr:amidohydrolase family protein [Flavobacteriaceae bacterium]